jgi:hypothetical protein
MENICSRFCVSTDYFKEDLSIVSFKPVQNYIWIIYCEAIN